MSCIVFKDGAEVHVRILTHVPADPAAHAGVQVLQLLHVLAAGSSRLKEGAHCEAGKSVAWLGGL